MLDSRFSRIAAGTLSMIGVPIVPGAIAQTRMPSAARSRASGSVMPRIAAFAAAYASWPVCPSMPAIEAVFTTTPRSTELVGVVAAHGRGREARHVERADRVHLHRGDERLLVVRRAVARDGPAAADAAPGDVHDEGKDADGARGVDGSRDVVVVVDVTADGDGPLTELLRESRGPLRVAIEDRNADAGVDETPNGRGAEPARSAGDER